MVSKELVKNNVLDLKEVLVDLSSAVEQQDYKDKVPYVHVPMELLEQWSDHMRMLDEVDWYSGLFTNHEITQFNSFNQTICRFSDKYGEAIPDVGDAFQNPDWCSLMSDAGSLLNSVDAKLDQLIKAYSTEQR